MEALVTPTRSFWAGKRVFVTGNTGFKGSWLWLWLKHLGATPSGFALPPDTSPCLWGEIVTPDDDHVLADIRNADMLARRMAAFKPDIVLHLAAQPLVRRSYREPLLTFETNVIGTINVLEAARKTPSVRALVSVTTDKVYLNREWVWPYREDEPLGGADPYSASKACAEIATAAWRQSYLDAQGVRVATARAGNVIGGGDWSADRLLPDCIAALAKGEPIVIRNPRSTRPWQHVVEPLAGYLILAQRLFESATGGAGDVASAWNFGPDASDVQPVSVLADEIVRLWGAGAAWEHQSTGGPHEAGLLAVDASKAKARLDWRPRLSLAEALEWTVDWSKRHMNGAPAGELVVEQIARYEAKTPRLIDQKNA